MLCRGVISHLAKAILSSPQKCSRFSSLSLTRNPLRNSFDDDVHAGSAVYQHALKFRRPGVIKWCKQLDNKASFIGSVAHDLRIIKRKTHAFGVYTWLKVQNSNGSSFRVLLDMWDGVAEFASKHLKRNDFIFVSGCLESYVKDCGRGNIQLSYKVIVKELNFVAGRPCHQESTEDYENRLHLWQVFFTNPHEWWDNRKRKVNPNSPDFKHKDTGEALWLSQDDPPWVKRQLQKLDSEIAEVVGPRSRVSIWDYHD